MATAPEHASVDGNRPLKHACLPRLLATRGGRELALFAAVYALYDVGRWLFVGHLVTALTHAHWVIHLERSVHLAIEGSVQRALDLGTASFVLSNVYLAAQLAVLPGALICLYRRAPDVYRRLRSTVIVTWLIATPIFALYPLAPPRLAAIGMQNTVSHQAAVALTGDSTIVYNPYAAVPSLHVGLAFAIGIAIMAAARSPRVVTLALGWGPVVTLAVVATGNQYMFEVATGLAVTALAYALARSAGRLPPRRLPARAPRRLVALPAAGNPVS